MKLITYGCSLTNYRWWTWADILAQNLNLPLVNRGRPACGNNFMFARLQHDIKSGLIEKNDIIRIMWCHYNRVNRILDLDRFEYGGDSVDQSQQIENFKSTISMIQQSETLLAEHNYEFMTWLPLTQNGEPRSVNASMLQSFANGTVESFDLENAFRQKIHAPLVDVVFKGSFTNRDDFAITYNDVPEIIQKNIIKQASKRGMDTLEFIRHHSGEAMLFFDYHPTPLHHLEYLQAIYPDMLWTPALIDQIHQENQQVLSQIWPEIPRDCGLTDDWKNIL